MSEPKTILVTGTSSGFGLLASRSLLQRGHTVFATMREAEGRNAGAAKELRELAADTDGTLHVLELDVTSDASVEQAVGQALKTAGRIDVAVNNAGMGCGGHAEAFTVEQFQQIFDINVFGVQRVNRAVLPAMREAGSGLLIHVSSIMGRVTLPFAGPYTATKWALEGLAESYRYELSSTGVDVAIVEPGGFATGIMDRTMAPADKSRVKSYGPLADLPKKMWGGMTEMLSGPEAPNPQDVADAIVQLIEAPAGARRLRVVVDPMTGGVGPSMINKTSDRVQSQMLTAFGMGQLLSGKSEHQHGD